MTRLQKAIVRPQVHGVPHPHDLPCGNVVYLDLPDVVVTKLSNSNEITAEADLKDAMFAQQRLRLVMDLAAGSDEAWQNTLKV